MKRAILSLLMILLSFAGPHARETRLHVVDYYNQIPSKYFGDQKYVLRQIGSTWETDSIAEYTINPVVDLKNGFVSINDPGTGGGSIIYEVALFLTRSRQPILGVSMRNFDGVFAETHIQFLVQDGKSWVDGTSKIIPNIHPGLFLKPDFYNQNKEKIDSLSVFKIVYKLPRYGTKVKLSLDQSALNFQKQNQNQEDRAFLQELSGQIARTELELTFQPDRGSFVLEK